MLELMITGFEFTAVQSTEISLLDIPQDFSADATICTKKPRDHHLVPRLIERDQQQWFVSMVRDPRDIVCSRHGLKPDAYWANLRQWREWLDNTRPYREHPRLVEVRYEELVRTPDAVQDMIAERIPFLALAGKFSKFHNVSQPSKQSLTAMRSLRPINDASVGRWRDHLPRIAGQMKIHGSISDELVELGYEMDASWLDELDHVEPDTSPGHWPEFMPAEHIQEQQQRESEKLKIYINARGL